MDVTVLKRCVLAETQGLALAHLNRALRDPHADIKKAASLALQRLHCGVSNESNGSSTEADLGCFKEPEDCEKLKEIRDLEKSIAVALIANASHQHSKVRAQSFSALHDLILFHSHSTKAESMRPGSVCSIFAIVLKGCWDWKRI